MFITFYRKIFLSSSCVSAYICIYFWSCWAIFCLAEFLVDYGRWPSGNTQSQTLIPLFICHTSTLDRTIYTYMLCMYSVFGSLNYMRISLQVVAVVNFNTFRYTFPKEYWRDGSKMASRRADVTIWAWNSLCIYSHF